MEVLTDKQKKVFQFIVTFIRQNGVPPTIREIMKGVGFSSPRPVQDHLRILQRKGYMELKHRLSRGIEVSPRLLGIPVLGKVGAGKTIAEEDIEGYIDVSNLFNKTANFFGLRVKGESMRDGDVVIVHKQSVAHPGDLVVVVKDEQASVRWLKKDREKLFLQADSLEEAYPPEFLSEQFHLVGKVVFMLRNYAYPLVSSYI
jgi:repressor LexA